MEDDTARIERTWGPLVGKDGGRESLSKLEQQLDGCQSDEEALGLLCNVAASVGSVEAVKQLLKNNHPRTVRLQGFKVLLAALMRLSGEGEYASEIVEQLQQSKLVAAKVLCAAVTFDWNERSTAVDMLFKTLGLLEKEPDAGILLDLYGQKIDLEAAKRWKRRIMSLIIGCYASSNDYTSAMHLCNSALEKVSDEQKVANLLQYARLRLQIGDIEAVKSLIQDIKRVPQITKRERTSLELLQGLLAYAESDYSQAISIFKGLQQQQEKTDPSFEKQEEEHYSKIDALDGLFEIKLPLEVTVSNNLSLCYLNCSDLASAISTLEACIRKNPLLHMNRSVIFNLCTLYDLALPTEQSAQAKRDLQRLSELLGIASRFDRAVDFRL